MTIIRVQKSKDNPYVQIDKRPLSDNRLTWKAKGILAYLLSKPDDWQVWVTDLVKRSKDGEHAVRTGLRELMKHGYATRKQERNEAGKYITLEWTIHEQPLVDFPDAANPHKDFPDAENSQYTNNDSTKTGEATEKDNTNMSADADFSTSEIPLDPDYPIPTKKEPPGYVPGPGKVVSCEDPDTGEEVGEPDWRFPQTQAQHQAFNATGRIRFASKAEWNKMQRIEKAIDNGELPQAFWKNRIWCAQQHRWSFKKLLQYTLSPDLLREWEKKQASLRYDYEEM